MSTTSTYSTSSCDHEATGNEDTIATGQEVQKGGSGISDKGQVTLPTFFLD